MNEQSWQIEGLIKRAFSRTKERFLSYFLTWIVSFGIGILTFLAILLIAGLLFLVFTITQSPIITAILGVVAGLGAIIGLMYVSTWISLTTILVLISDEKLGIGETFKQTQPKVWQYLWVNLLIFLFMLGIYPISIFTLFIIFILWSVWATFVPFVFLKQNLRGFNNLWMSREMFFQKAWGIFGRSLLVGGAVMTISVLISIGGKNAASTGLSVLFSVFSAPFMISFTYEMYKNLEVPKEVKKPKVWFVLSMIGLVLMAICLIFGIFAAAQGATGMIEEVQKNPQGIQDIFKDYIPTPTEFPIEVPIF